MTLDGNVVAPQLDHSLGTTWITSNHAARQYPFSSYRANTAGRSPAAEVSRVARNESPGERFFKTADLLEDVFDYFHKDNYTPYERRQLLGFMLISKSAFHYPARILWSRIGKKFARALTSLLDIEKWDNNFERQLAGYPLLTTMDRNRERLATHLMWAKFQYYAGAIQWIEATTADISPGTIAFLTRLLPDSDPVLFPSLRYLSWTETFADSDDLLHMLSPSLHELQLHIYDFYDTEHTSFAFSEWAVRIFHGSTHLCPNLRFFGLGGMGPLILNSSVLTYFGSLHQLMITQQAFGSDEEVLAPPTSFSALKDLEWTSYHGSNSLLRSLPYIIPFVSDTLRTVYLQSLGQTSVLDTASFMHNFGPLFELNRLTEVCLNFAQLEFVFTDGDLVAVAKAWPNIVEMGFAFKYFQWAPVPRLATIGVVATHCRFLKKVTLPHVLGPDPYTVFEVSAPPSHPLQEIRVHMMTWSPRQNSAITSRLEEAFPNLQGVSMTNPDNLHDSLWAILPPYILHSKIAGKPTTRIPRKAVRL